MSSEATPENVLQKINKICNIMDDIFHLMDKTTLDSNQRGILYTELNEIVAKLYKLNTYLYLKENKYEDKKR